MFSFIIQIIYIIYIKSHKFNTLCTPHEQRFRIKPPSTLPTFLKTGAAKRTALRTVSSLERYDPFGKQVSSRPLLDLNCLHSFREKRPILILLNSNGLPLRCRNPCNYQVCIQCVPIMFLYRHEYRFSLTRPR